MKEMMRKIFCMKQQILKKKPRTTLDEYETLTENYFPIRKFTFDPHADFH